jgi:hypothetical protein
MDRHTSRRIPRLHRTSSGVVKDGLQSAGDVRFVQFPHPGKEHTVGPTGVRPWPRADELHRRTFLQSRAHYRLARDGTDEYGDVAFWGEWEGQAQLIAELDPVPEGPRFLCTPDPRGEPPASTDGTPPQNTDPFVWGEAMAYIGCRQPRNRKLRELGRGSLILFGSNLNGRFVLDTVLVVDGWAEHDCDSFTAKLDGIASEAHIRAGVAPFHGWGMKKALRYYAGATSRDSVEGMYSFVPCLPSAGKRIGFARPELHIDGLIDPDLRMQARSSKPLDPETVAELWNEVVNQVTRQGLALATQLELPA